MYIPWVSPLKDKKGIITISNAFQKKNLDESNCKPNKEISSKKSWLQDNNIMKENLLLLKNLLEP